MTPLGWGDKERPNARADDKLVQAISEHVQGWIGPIEGVFHEDRSDTVHVDVYWVAPGEERPFHTLVTSGAAQRAMLPPRGAESNSHFEGVMFLPSSWNLAEPSRDETWPILALRAIARYPHKNRTRLWGGHTLPLGYEAAKPFSSTVLTRPYLLDPKGGRLDLGPRRRIEFFSLVSLFPQELSFVRENDAKALLDMAEKNDRLQEILVTDRERTPLLTSV